MKETTTSIFNSIGGYEDDEGDFHTDSSGVEKLAEALKINSALQTLKYAAMHSIPCTANRPSCPHITHTQVSAAAVTCSQFGEKRHRK